MLLLLPLAVLHVPQKRDSRWHLQRQRVQPAVFHNGLTYNKLTPQTVGVSTTTNAAFGSAAGGFFTIAAGATSFTASTTAVTANTDINLSQISTSTSGSSLNATLPFHSGKPCNTNSATSTPVVSVFASSTSPSFKMVLSLRYRPAPRLTRCVFPGSSPRLLGSRSLRAIMELSLSPKVPRLSFPVKQTQETPISLWRPIMTTDASIPEVGDLPQVADGQQDTTDWKAKALEAQETAKKLQGMAKRFKTKVDKSASQNPPMSLTTKVTSQKVLTTHRKLTSRLQELQRKNLTS